MFPKRAKSAERTIGSANLEQDQKVQSGKVQLDLEGHRMTLTFANGSGLAETLKQIVNNGGLGVEINDLNQCLVELQVIDAHHSKVRKDDFESQNLERDSEYSKLRRVIAEMESFDTNHLMIIKRVATRKIRGDEGGPDKNFQLKNGVLYAVWNDPDQNGKKIYQNIESEVTPEERALIIELLEKTT